MVVGVDVVAVVFIDVESTFSVVVEGIVKGFVVVTVAVEGAVEPINVAVVEASPFAQTDVTTSRSV